VRDLYGREEWGQGFLVARRLVEAGVRVVQVNLRGWDTHQNAFRDLKGKLLPSLDRLPERLPRRSGAARFAGRDAGSDVWRDGAHAANIAHCPRWQETPRGRSSRPADTTGVTSFRASSLVPGIKAGEIVGQTDRQGGAPVTEAYTPADLAATLFHLFGVGPDTEFHDAEGRPYRLTQGLPMRPLVV